MKIIVAAQKPNRNGSALMLVLIMSALALIILGSVMTWSSTNTKLTYRSIQYTRSVAAAEAATEKVVSQITQDFLYGGESKVDSSVSVYQNMVPSTSDSAYWSTWEFNDGNGNIGQNYVQHSTGSNYVVLDSTYAGLKAFVSTYTIVSHARDTASSQDVVGGVLQTLQLATIPIFQFAMYSSGNMEISCGHPFNVTGRVHSNGILYVEPDSALTFESGVTAVITNVFQRDTADGDTRGAPAGSVVYVQPDLKISPYQAYTLPIGETNTPSAVREIIEPPQSGEDPNSPLGQLRYYNQCDLVLIVSNNTITAVKGYFNPAQMNGTGTIGGLITPTNELSCFVSVTNNFFQDWREGKTVQPIDINIGNLTSWSLTNSHLANLTSLYVVDDRALPDGSLGAVRVFNGTNLPPNGLTVATARPLYVWGDYNELNGANLGTTNTSMTRPASLVADAITFLSDAWTDANSTNAYTSRVAVNTTVNAALLTGVVETAPQPAPLTGYSGGMENFPRFLEYWGSGVTNTYNGSMIKMFPSLYATNAWGKDNVYEPPARNWAYDANFDSSTGLPPKTPGLLKVIRNQWATVANGTNGATLYP